ncbi:MAG: fasciclin domain-containing protein [Cyclobacteriaceae bacterium]
MKKLSLTLLISLGLLAGLFTACEEDEPDPEPTPTITSLTPNSGPVGATVTIAGTNFGTSPTVSFGGTNATVTSPSNTSLTTTVPAGLTAGAVDVTVTANGQTSAASTFTVTEDEEVTTIADLAGDTDNLSVLLAALSRDAAADLLAAAADEDATLTVFAPTDAAFEEYLDANGHTSLDDVSDEELVAVLQDHIIGSVVASSAIENGQITEAQSGESLLFTANDDGVFVNNAQVTTPDVTAGNGVVHIVDAVIIGANIPEGDAAPWVSGHLQFNNNMIADPQLAGISRTANQMLNPVPSAEAVTSNLAAYPDDPFFDEVSYKGAFDPAGENWMNGWSSLWKLGYLAGSPTTPEAPFAAGTEFEPIPNPVTEDLTLTSDQVWLLDGLTYVEGGTLTIEPGTVVVAASAPSTGENTSALIITTDARIDAQGTAEAPIIFTSEDDDGTKSPDGAGEWGGIIVLGTAPIGFGTEGTNSIEGIDPNEPRGQYGGTDEDDDSGIMRYVSIRYSGVGIAPGDEIQGLSLGGVGRGTTFEYIDIFSSGDDGIEWFGGTADMKYGITAFVDDDNFDYDYGWSGRAQFMFALQSEALDNSDHGGEWDGANPDNAEPFSNPTLYNVTMIGLGQSNTIRDTSAPAILMRDNTGGTLANSIITDFNGKGIEVENLAGTDGDSYNQLINRNIRLLNNVWNVNPDYDEVNADENTGIVYPTDGF